MKTKVAYISGPISGLKNGNYENFRLAQVKLEKEGYIVVNPHEIGKTLYEKWSKIPRPEGNKAAQEYDKQMWQEFMKLDIKYLMGCDCIFLLDNWETSKGAKLELLLGQKLGLKIYHMRDFSDFDVHLEITKLDRIPV